MAIAEQMRAALGATQNNDEKEEDAETQDPPSQKKPAARRPKATQDPPSQKKPAARRPQATQDPPSQKKLAARRPLLKRSASHTGAPPAKRQKRPATTTSTEAHPNLRFPGAGKQKPLHYKQSRVYTDVKNSRLRLYRRAGDTIDKSLYWEAILLRKSAGA